VEKRNVSDFTSTTLDERQVKVNYMFVLGATAPSGPGPPHSRGF